MVSVESGRQSEESVSVNQAQGSAWNFARNVRKVCPHMTLDEARESIISGINYAAYRETDFSLHDSDMNRLFGSEHYKSARPIYEPSAWAEGDFEAKMAMLLVWANELNRSMPAFTEAQRLLESEDSVMGRVIRASKKKKAGAIVPGTKFARQQGPKKLG
jgi:hypothetical protein